jgi:hypothetical protein
MYWPWGEPAVYVFTLMSKQDFYPPNVLLDTTLCQGAYLVSTGKEIEGYTLMAQADRYMTVIVGASTDMPSFIKAHAGLPEHVLSLALMLHPPAQPYWIYGGLFYTFMLEKRPAELGEAEAVEIHLNKTVALRNLENKKSGTIPAYAEQLEWGQFLAPNEAERGKEPLPSINVKKVLEGKHLLPVEELNIRGNWVGCSPAAFYNCLKYLEKRGKVSTQGKGVNTLLDWISICYRTNPANWFTSTDWILKGSEIMFKGLGYNSNCTAVERQNDTPNLFLTKYADEINAKYPTNLGGSGKGVFTNHSTTGIGYWKQGGRIQLIIHDGWKTTPNQPVYVKYSGYSDAELEYPRYMRTFHPSAKANFPKALPKIDAPEKVLFSVKNNSWNWKFKIISDNEVKSEIYKYVIYFYNVKSKKYYQEGPKRVYPYYAQGQGRWVKPQVIAGKFKPYFYLVDDNGHLLKKNCTVVLQEAIVGTWLMTYKWKKNSKPYTCDWYVYSNGKYKDSEGASGIWTIDGKNVRLTYQTGTRPVYSGKINDNADRMSGTMKDATTSGTWSATRKGDVTLTVKEGLPAGTIKPDGGHS